VERVKTFWAKEVSQKAAARDQLVSHEPYKTSTEALAQWVETATCVGVTLDEKDNVILTAPRGTKDLVTLVLRPTPDNIKDPKTFHDRIQSKQWLIKWPKLHVINT
jgi:uncharacterized protein